MPDSEPRPVVAGGPVGNAVALGAAATDAGIRLSSLSANQVVTLGAVMSMVVMTGMVIWNIFDSRNDRRDERAVWARSDAEHSRSNEDGRERDRTTLERIAKSNQELSVSATAQLQEKWATTAAQSRKEILQHCTEEGEKNRKAMDNLTAVLSKLLMKKEEADGGNVAPAVAPYPRPKMTTTGVGLRNP